VAAGDGVVPLRYAARPFAAQRRVAQRIVDLRLLRDPRLDQGDLRQRAAVVTALAEELERLEGPFRDPHVHRPRRGEGRFDEDGADYDEASFLRQFDGEPGLAGDVLLAQVEVRLAGRLFQPLLGLTEPELRRATAWWASLGTVEFEGLGGATRRIAAFYDQASSVLERLAGERDAAEAREEMLALLPLLRARAEQFSGLDTGPRVFDVPPTLVTRVGPFAVPVRVVQAAAEAMRSITGRRSAAPPPEEEEPPEPTVAV
jgi:hypothetical protein